MKGETGRIARTSEVNSTVPKRRFPWNF